MKIIGSDKISGLLKRDGFIELTNTEWTLLNRCYPNSVLATWQIISGNREVLDVIL
ncbi:MAG: hypothetical protein OXU36_22505 [Candidatus Poribacteria bacterium]|nr:hypothetical protein [Candidatus Poribacteria bacterium]